MSRGRDRDLTQALALWGKSADLKQKGWLVARLWVVLGPSICHVCRLAQLPLFPPAASVCTLPLGHADCGFAVCARSCRLLRSCGGCWRDRMRASQGALHSRVYPSLPILCLSASAARLCSTASALRVTGSVSCLGTLCRSWSCRASKRSRSWIWTPSTSVI